MPTAWSVHEVLRRDRHVLFRDLVDCDFSASFCSSLQRMVSFLRLVMRSS